MDSIKFEVYEDGPFVFVSSPKAKFARTIINGRPIMEGVKECERCICYDRDNIGGHMYQFAESLYRYLTDKDYRVEDEIVLLICGGCLDEFCWPVLAKMEEKPDLITWSDFYNPFICDDPSDETFKPFDIGPFHFARDEFEAAVKNLGEQIREGKK